MRQHNPLVLPRNAVGTDYVVGDLHGHYTNLMDELDACGFDSTKDRLLCVGDLVDRGPESLECLRLLEQPWFFACLGNHEDMMLQALVEQDVSAFLHWKKRCGGNWVDSVDLGPLTDLLVEHVARLPLAIEVPVNNRKVGLVHAAVTSGVWGQFDLEADIWNRRIAAGRAQDDAPVPHEAQVQGVDAVVVGHSITEAPCVRGNTLLFDTGAAMGLEPTVWTLDRVLNCIDVHQATGMPLTYFSCLTATVAGHSLTTFMTEG